MKECLKAKRNSHNPVKHLGTVLMQQAGLLQSSPTNIFGSASNSQNIMRSLFSNLNGSKRILICIHLFPGPQLCQNSKGKEYDTKTLPSRNWGCTN
jgi:hypothetical protein